MIDNELYLEDIKNTIKKIDDWHFIKNKTIFISGACGMISSFIIDVIMYRNNIYNDNCTIIANGRDESKIREKFLKYINNKNFKYYVKDVNEKIDIEQSADYIIHAASNTHPMLYSEDPVGTIMTNVMGTNNLLEYAVKNKVQKFVFLSTVEIYGESKGDVEKFKESYLGYINCNTLRAGYPESKRTGEALCQAYASKYNLNILIPRLPRIYGPTMLMSDTKAMSQFIKKSINNEDIVLKSEGNQYYSYLYVADAATGILTILRDGTSGEAYNLASENSNITLKELAKIIAEQNNKNVIFELPSEQEKKGYSTATKAVMDSTKVEKDLHWTSMYDIKNGITRTIEILRQKMRIVSILLIVKVIRSNIKNNEKENIIFNTYTSSRWSRENFS